MSISETRTYRGYRIETHYDEHAENPREFYDHIGKIVYNHRDYILGDEQYQSNFANNWKEWFAEYIMQEYSPVNDEDWDNFGYLSEAGYDRVWKWIEKNAVYRAVSAYIHSGVTVSTSSGYPYNDRWSGRLHLYPTGRHYGELGEEE